MKKYWLILFLITSSFWSYSQELELVFSDTPLNEVLIELREKYDLQFSFDNRSLSNYRITIDQKFSEPEDAIRYLLEGIPYRYEKSGDVFLIYPYTEMQETTSSEIKNYRLAGHVSDVKTGESLPFSRILINGHGQITDQEGNFSFVSATDSVFHIQVSYLGYYMLDTIIGSGIQQQLYLIPSLYTLQEVQVAGKRIVKNLQIGNTAGEMRLNHQVAGYLPGYGDNSVFNLLRLQPGILAAGEQSNDLIIWGSYEGQSQVLFDGFTLFGMKNFNDNISAVNPYMAKDIQVMKGGYRAEYGERVGGLVNITGTDGSRDDFHLKMNLNNMTLNGYISIPIAQKSSFVLALRQTYYELYDPAKLSINSKGRAGNLVDRNLYPDYNFRDLNLRFSGETDNGDSYSISFLNARDRFSYSLEYDTQRSNLIYEDKENNQQTGFSAVYNKGWASGNRSELTVAHSELNTETSRIHQSGQGQSTGGSGNGPGSQGGEGNFQTNVNEYKQNKIAETKINLQNHISLSPSHKLGFGGSFFNNQVNFREDSFEVMMVMQQLTTNRIDGYVEDHFSPASVAEFVIGIRTDYPLDIEKFYFQPRLSGTINLNDNLKINGAWGLYNQYITRSTVIDELGNYRYMWTICDNKETPVLHARHAVMGITLNRNNFTFSAEAFDKKTEGLTRYIENEGSSDVFEGKSKSRGIDFFIKQDYKGNSFWVAYTLSQTLEHFSYFATNDYQRALHDQRHELKMAALIQLKPFYFSANYVFGSGFPDPLLAGDEDFERDYHRVDVSAVYRFNMKKSTLEAGLSVLNVFNYENIKYNNFIRVPDDQDSTLNLHAEAVPFTPTMYVNFSF